MRSIGSGFVAPVLVMVCALLILPGCASISRTGRTVHTFDVHSLKDLPPAVQRIYQVTSLGSVQGTKISRHGEHVTSQSLNYVVGMVPTIPKGTMLGTLTAQADPQLDFVIFNNGSNCTSLPAKLKSSLSSAVQATLMRAGNPMPPGTVEIHFVPPVTRIFILTTDQSPIPRIFLTFYFQCIGSGDPANPQYFMSQAVSSVMHELTHTTFQWDGKGDGDQFTADGAAACFIKHLQGLEPGVLKQLPYWWKANAQADQFAASGNKEANLDNACQQWMASMQQLQVGG